MRTPSRRRTPRRVADLVPRALRDLGVPSARLTHRVRDAWARVADASWAGQAEPEALVGGVLEVGVRSASLRQELAQFHHDRLLQVLRTALPDLPLLALRFKQAEAPEGA